MFLSLVHAVDVKNHSQNNYFNELLRKVPMGITVARMIIVVLESPLLSLLLLLPPLVLIVYEATGILAIELERADDKLFCRETA
jgi:hypothetical protein